MGLRHRLCHVAELLAARRRLPRGRVRSRQRRRRQREVDRSLQSGNNLILDLSQATFIDSSVVQVLVRAANAVNGCQRAVVLQLGTAAVVERVLEIVGIERVLPRAHTARRQCGSPSRRSRPCYRAARNQSMFRVVNERMRELNEAFAALTDTYTTPASATTLHRLHHDDPDSLRSTCASAPSRAASSATRPPPHRPRARRRGVG